MAYGINAPFGLRPVSSITGGSWTEKTNTYYIYTSSDGQTTYNASIYTGDPVIFSSASARFGTVEVYNPTFADNTPSTFSAVPILGVFYGCEYYNTNNQLIKSQFWPASTLVYPGSFIKASIIDDPNVIYDVQISTHINANGNAFVASPVFPNANANLPEKGSFGSNFALNIGGGTNFDTVLDPNGNPYNNNPASGSVISGQSAFYLDVSTTSAGGATHDYSKIVNTLPLKAISYTLNPNNIAQPTLTIQTTPFINVLVMLNNTVYGHNTPGPTLA
jgi:hypothetical protein